MIREIPAPGFGTYGDLIAFAFDWYIDPASSHALPPDVALRVYDYGDPRSFFLYWDTCSPTSPCFDRPTDVWQRSDILGVLSIQAAEDNVPPASLSDIPADAPIVGIHLRANYSFGEQWRGFVDNVVLGFRGQKPTLYNFEPDPLAELWTLNYVRFGSYTDPDKVDVCEIVNGDPCSGTTGVPGTLWNADYYSDSSAEFGILHAKAQVTLGGDGSSGGYNKFLSVGGNANYRDTITVTGASGQGTLTLRFRVTGTSSQTPGQSGRAQFQRVTFAQDGAWLATDYLPDASGFVNIPLDITFGEPLEYMIRFYALAQIWDYTAGAAASADFYNTAVLDQVQVYDAAGNQVPDFVISAASGSTYSSFGVAQPIEIDVKPGTTKNPINLKSNGLVPVAILSNPAFQATALVDPASLRFGSLGNENSLAFCNSNGEDVNGDGLVDLVCHFNAQRSAFTPNSTTATLEGKTIHGQFFKGIDTITIVNR